MAMCNSAVRVSFLALPGPQLASAWLFQAPPPPDVPTVVQPDVVKAIHAREELKQVRGPRNVDVSRLAIC